MTHLALVLRYGAFAAAATVANLTVQRACLPLFGFAMAMGAGTLVGLVVKYLLDRRWIFHQPAGSGRETGRSFALYTVTGIGTTVLFWGTETVFWAIGQTTAWREIGAIIGLTIGYVVKYRLDRRFVFASGQTRAQQTGAVT